MNHPQEDVLGGDAALPAAHARPRGDVAQRDGDGGDGGRAQVQVPLRPGDAGDVAAAEGGNDGAGGALRPGRPKKLPLPDGHEQREARHGRDADHSQGGNSTA